MQPDAEPDPAQEARGPQGDGGTWPPAPDREEYDLLPEEK
jgi:hypothetical protein